MTKTVPQDWRDDLPAVRGRLLRDAPLGRLVWFKVGGPAELLFLPADPEDLCQLLAACPIDIPRTIIGAGSNLLIRDGGVPGLVIRLDRHFATVVQNDDQITAGARAMDINVARLAQAGGLAGLEFLRGVPGTIGGAVRMNAGAYDRELKDVLLSAQAVDFAGQRHVVTGADLGFSYRHCAAPEDWIFIEARLQGVSADPAAIAARMADITDAREASQPVHSRTGGSSFKNPPGKTAWRLIDQASCRGLQIGAAQVSTRHCNFMINLGGASATDLEALGEEVRRRVYHQCGITLEWEIRRLGTYPDQKSIGRGAS